MEESIFTIGQIAGSAEDDTQQTATTVIDAPGVTLEVQTEESVASLAGQQIGQGEVTLTLPASVADLDPSGSGVTFMLAVLDETFYPASTGGSTDLKLAGKAISSRLTTTDGVPIPLDPTDPAILHLQAPPRAADSNTRFQLNSSSSNSLRVGSHGTMVMNFDTKFPGSKFVVTARFDSFPSDSSFDFQASVEDGVLRSTKGEKFKMDFYLRLAILKIVVYEAGTHGNTLYFASEFEGLNGANITGNQRRLLSTVDSTEDPTVEVSELAVAYWDSNCVCWTSSPSVQVKTIDMETSQLL
ncbi:hypothetical protein PoB_004291100 [Plakobranchus ocellatus]|uniref:Uncharacterized protein n=1 Tax=Plakobranchus ocellatus TaxID=259542 RepID=A0AAV4AZ62_9GAST|nr:hypothetical protein PoB_004291100 [Plakobranchus ocellatus]